MQRIRRVKIGTRGSALALAQTHSVTRKLKNSFPHITFEAIVIKTLGDEFQAVELFKQNQTGVFTKAIEKKLLSGEIDMAVHSLKDLPTDSAKGLMLAAIVKRLDSRDALVSKEGFSLKTLPKGSRVGTGSPRRKCQLQRARPDLKLIDIRGNLDTRVSKALEKKEWDAVVVAYAGLKRLGKYLRFAVPLSRRDVLPAVGQAALAIQTRANDKPLLKIAKTLNHPRAEMEVTAERIFLARLQGGCRVPIGVWAGVREKKFYMKGALFSTTNSSEIKIAEASGALKDYKKVALNLAGKILK
ncbi:MAG: hydroxymethylbilane synthase [Candidatus Omnitrophica bacterium]|nr:hydroxymethylbilane synthase [Candidatus Omnitrophota bacterium]